METVAANELDFEQFATKDLQLLDAALNKRIVSLESENVLFASYLGRVVPKDSPEVKDQSADAESVLNKDSSRREKKKKGDKKGETDRILLLTLEQKSEIATRELEELRDEIHNNKEEWAKVMDNSRAELEEIEVRSLEIKKEAYEFQRDISHAIHPRTGKVIAVRVVRYFEEKIRDSEATIEKLRLKNATLKVQKNKLRVQLKQKEEIGEVLHAIDFDQLQIENKQFILKIEERNSELLKLKMIAGKTVQKLNQYKQKLGVASTEFDRINMEISTRMELNAKLSLEDATVADEIGKAKEVNTWILDQIETYQAPDVLSYVVAKANQQDLQKKLVGWERKVDIAKIESKRMRVVWNAQKSTIAKQDKPDSNIHISSNVENNLDLAIS